MADEMHWSSYNSGKKKGREEGYEIGYAKGYKDALRGVPNRHARADTIVFIVVATAGSIIGILAFVRLVKEIVP
jgi:hypothetical protein